MSMWCNINRYEIIILFYYRKSYCLLNKVPPLTTLVVSKNTGLPGSGFSAVNEIPKFQIKVFEYDWLKHGCPSPENFAKAVEDRPPNAAKNS
jgi:hypothetical protein